MVNHTWEICILLASSLDSLSSALWGLLCRSPLEMGESGGVVALLLTLLLLCNLLASSSELPLDCCKILLLSSWLLGVRFSVVVESFTVVVERFSVVVESSLMIVVRYCSFLVGFYSGSSLATLSQSYFVGHLNLIFRPCLVISFRNSYRLALTQSFSLRALSLSQRAALRLSSAISSSGRRFGMVREILVLW